jgi:hypothetical protein
VLLKTPCTARPTARDVADFDHEYTVLARLSGTAAAAAIALEDVEGRPWLVLEERIGRSMRHFGAAKAARARQEPSVLTEHVQEE